MVITVLVEICHGSILGLNLAHETNQVNGLLKCEPDHISADYG